MVRFLDTETMDNMEILSECVRFVKQIRVLFDQRCCLVTGYTGVMLNMLKKERVLFIDHKPKKVGGKPSDEMTCIINHCLARLRQWTLLAPRVLQAEFPQFEIRR